MDPGHLDLHLCRTDGRLHSLRIHSSRPRIADRLVGLPVAEAIARIPRLFSLCAQAQGHAARLAWQTAIDPDPPAKSSLPLPQAVCCEIIGEHLWRLLLDWPPLMGAAPRATELRHWRQQLRACQQRPETAADLAAALRQALPELLPEPWLERLQQLQAPPTRPPLHLLDWGPHAPWPALTSMADGHPQRMEHPRHACSTLTSMAEAHPQRMDSPRHACSTSPPDQPETTVGTETGALCRQQHQADIARLLLAGQRLAARLLARRHDLLQLANGLIDAQALSGWASTHRLDSVPGLAIAGEANKEMGGANAAGATAYARVETARGTLLHMMQVNDGRVAAYAIVAPTERNFHPQGPLCADLQHLPTRTLAEARFHVQAAVLALDPCVGYEMVIEDA